MRYVSSTETVSATDWRDTVCAFYSGLALDWLGDQPVRARIESCAFADARAAHITNSPVRIVRSSPPAGARETGYWLALQVAGSTRYSRARGKTVDLVQNPGDLVLLDPGLSFDAVSPSPIHLLIWDLPQDSVAPLLVAPERGLRHVQGISGAGAVLGSYARILMNEAEKLDAVAQHTLRMHLCGLTALALGPAPAMCESRHETYRIARRHQILAYVETHLRNHCLTAERAASELGISRRWLHALFDETGMTFAAWVARRRIEECRKCLEDPASDQLSVTEIAFLYGFNDLSTFNRRFRRQYGLTPLEVRRGRTTQYAIPHEAIHADC